MKKTYTILSMIKIGSEKNMLDLLENGTIYMNPINEFRKIEDNNLRGDKYEGVRQIWNLPSGEFEIPAINHKGNYIGIHMQERVETIFGNIYSLYSISSRGFTHPNDFFVDERLTEFGSHFVIIKDLPEFLSRMKNKLSSTKRKFRHNFIDYYDKNSINSSISIFQKPNEFEYQKEFRFYLESSETLPLNFSIGCLKEIAEIFPVSFLKELKLARKSIS